MAKRTRAIIDATGLKIAPAHYRMFPFEPSVAVADDMEVYFDEKEDMIKNITLLKVIERLLALDKEPVVLIVAHGTKGGFVMPVTPGGVAAVAANLDAMVFLMEAHKTAARLVFLEKFFTKKDQSAGWQKLLRTLPGGEGAVVNPGEGDKAHKLYTDWERKQLARLRVTIDVLRGLLAKRDRLVNRKLERIEIRACNMGKSPNELDGIRRFLGAKKIVAPNQDTFFGTTKPEFLKASTTLIEWCKKRGGTDNFMIDGGFALNVTEVVHARYTTKAASVSEQAVKDWVKKHVMTTAPLLVPKEFHLMALRSRQDPKNRHPFTFPLDSGYRRNLVLKG